VPYCSVGLGWESQKIIGEPEAEMLRAIRRTESFTSAALTLGISYAHLWNSISHIEQMLGFRIVRAERGGAKGGMAYLTKEGTSLLQHYTRLESRVEQFVTGKISRESQFEVKPSLSFVGSHCIVVERLLQTLHDKHMKMSYRIVNVGSLGGLTAMMLREADVAGIHIFDEETRIYNRPLLSKYSLSNTCALVRGYTRKQCLMVRKGNPKKINSVADLLHRNVKLANRNLGSGTRILLDYKLSELARTKSVDFSQLTKRIRGYEMELMTHNQVARAVLSRRADVGVGLAPVASEMGLEAISFALEDYDFVVEKRRRNPYVREFIDILSSKAFQRHIEATTPGVSFTSQSGKILD